MVRRRTEAFVAARRIWDANLGSSAVSACSSCSSCCFSCSESGTVASLAWRCSDAPSETSIATRSHVVRVVRPLSRRPEPSPTSWSASSSRETTTHRLTSGREVGTLVPREPFRAAHHGHTPPVTETVWKADEIRTTARRKEGPRRGPVDHRNQPKSVEHVIPHRRGPGDLHIAQGPAISGTRTQCTGPSTLGRVAAACCDGHHADHCARHRHAVLLC